MQLIYLHGQTTQMLIIMREVENGTNRRERWRYQTDLKGLRLDQIVTTPGNAGSATEEVKKCHELVCGEGKTKAEAA